MSISEVEANSPDFWLGTLSATIGHYLQDGNQDLLVDAYSRYRESPLAESSLPWLPVPPMRGRSDSPSSLRPRATRARRWRMALPDLQNLTPEQFRNVEMYGWCGVCGSPREVVSTVTERGGSTQTFIRLECPNNHSQDQEWDEEE